MCKYCENKETVFGEAVNIDIEQQTIVISNIAHGFFEELNINYCPFCGRKL